MGASVRINRGPIDANAYLEDVRREDWRLLLAARGSFVRTTIPYDCRELLRFVEDAETMHGPLGYASVPDFIRDGLGVDPKLVEWAKEGLRLMAQKDDPAGQEGAT